MKSFKIIVLLCITLFITSCTNKESIDLLSWREISECEYIDNIYECPNEDEYISPNKKHYTYYFNDEKGELKDLSFIRNIKKIDEEILSVLISVRNTSEKEMPKVDISELLVLKSHNVSLAVVKVYGYEFEGLNEFPLRLDEQNNFSLFLIDSKIELSTLKNIIVSSVNNNDSHYIRLTNTYVDNEYYEEIYFYFDECDVDNMFETCISK